MGAARIAIPVERGLLCELDRLVREGVYPNRSRVIQEAIRERIAKHRRRRLQIELAKIDPREERELAEERLRHEPTDPT